MPSTSSESEAGEDRAVPDGQTTTEEPAAAADPRPGRAGVVLITTVAVLLAVATGVLTFLLLDDDPDDGGDELRRRAGQFAEALVSYDHRDPEAHRDRVLSFATGSFRSEYEDAFDRGLAQIITEVEAESQGFVKDVWVSAIDDDQASAVVSVDIDHDGTGGPRTLYDIYFQLTLVRVGGEWKVDQVTDLSFAGSSPTLPTDVTSDTDASTTTSVP